MYKIPGEDLLKASGMDLSNGETLQELAQIQECLSDYKIVVFSGLSSDKVMFGGNSLSSKKFYLLYNADTKHYSVTTNIKASITKKDICNTCDTLYELHKIATKPAPFVLFRCHVLKMKPSIVVYTIGGFTVRNVFRII